MSDDIQKIINRSSNPKLIKEAFEFAENAYKDRYRLSGENYIVHATRVASMLDKMNLDSTTVAFGLLHDVLDDDPDSTRKAEIKEIEKKFGKDLSQLVDKVSRLSRIRYPLAISIKNQNTITREKIENLRRMFLALSGDLRIVIVELISRLDGLNHMQYLPKELQKISSLETLQVFVPIAGRLGLSEIRRNLEDMAFCYLLPNKFSWVKENVKEQYETRERYLKKFIPHIDKIFKKEHIKIVDINYRVKSYWSIYRKLLKHSMDFDKIHDLLALRIIVSDVESCYRVLGTIHKHLKPISEEINDYIAHPKSNGYRSLHTTIFSEGDKVIEIQIRTEEMHKEAEYGVCAHWSYKENIDLKNQGDDFEWVASFRNRGKLGDINKKLVKDTSGDISDFWKNFKIDFFQNKVFSFTPMGDIIVLPKESTAVDFAYAVHSYVGNHCDSAKIGGKIAPLDHILENGDIVEITMNKNKIPSKDWLKFVKTSLARSHIKRLTEQESAFKFPIPGFIKKKIIEISEASKQKREDKQKFENVKIKQIYLAGQKGMLVHIAKCCNPQPGDKVLAYLAQNRSAVLHRTSCSNFKKIAEKYPEKIVEASWK